MASGSQIHYKQNRLKQLRAFCHAAQTGSITEAAETLFVSSDRYLSQAAHDLMLEENELPTLELAANRDLKGDRR